MSFTAEQLEARRATLGASEIAAVCGLNPWKTAHDVWLSKLGLADQESSHATRIGSLMEPVVRQLYTEETGRAIETMAPQVHPVHAWMSATPDFRCVADGRLGEIKCVGWRSAHHWTQEADGIPDYYRPQVEWQLEVCGADVVDVAALIGGTEFRIYTIKRDPALAEMLRGIGDRFWREHVLARVPPTVDHTENARRMLETLYPRHVSALKPATPEVEALAAELAEARRRAKTAEDAKATAENRMREAIGDGEGFFAESFKVTWKATKTGARPLKFTAKGEAV